MIKLYFNFKDYPPLEINVNSTQDVVNFNNLINYCMQGAKFTTTSEITNKVTYDVDMSFEDMK